MPTQTLLAVRSIEISVLLEAVPTDLTEAETVVDGVAREYRAGSAHGGGVWALEVFLLNEFWEYENLAW